VIFKVLSKLSHSMIPRNVNHEVIVICQSLNSGIVSDFVYFFPVHEILLGKQNPPVFFNVSPI